MASWTEKPERFKSTTFCTPTDWYKCPTNIKRRKHPKLTCGKKGNSFNISDVTT